MASGIDPIDPDITPTNYPRDRLLRTLWQLGPIARPMTEHNLLAPNEEIRYRKNRHWFTLVYPALQTIVVVGIAVTVFVDFALWTNAAVVLLAVPAIILVFNLIFDSESRPSKQRTITVLVLILVAMVFLTPRVAALVVAVAFGLRMFTTWLRWRYYVQVIVTTRRLIMTDGLATQIISTMLIDKVTDTSIFVSPLGELLGYGDFLVETAGQDQAFSHIHFVQFPGVFNNSVLQVLAEHAGGPPRVPPPAPDPAFRRPQAPPPPSALPPSAPPTGPNPPA